MSSGARRPLAAGGDVTFERFVLGYSRTLLRSAYLLCGDRGHAEDLLQLTLLRTARRWSVAHTAPEAYARRVLVNLSRDRRRHRRRRVSEYPLAEADHGLVGSEFAERVIGRDAVIAALRHLPDRQREVLVMRFYGDLTVAETAAAIGASEGTVKSYSARALSRMRELLNEPSENLTEQTVEVHDDD